MTTERIASVPHFRRVEKPQVNEDYRVFKLRQLPRPGEPVLKLVESVTDALGSWTDCDSYVASGIDASWTPWLSATPPGWATAPTCLPAESGLPQTSPASVESRVSDSR
jgi:hypothetical protein